MLKISANRARPSHLPKTAGGFSLIELLIVVTLLGIVTGAVLTYLQSTVNDQLDAAARIVASDLDYVRNLAVSNNSSYRITFAPGQSEYYFEHSGSNTWLDTLPASPHGGKAASRTRQSTDIALISLNAASVRVAAVHVVSPTPMDVTDLEFGPLGETTRAEETTIWLAAGASDAKRFLPLVVNPVTGNTQIGEQTSVAPYIPGAEEAVDPDATPEPPLDPVLPPTA